MFFYKSPEIECEPVKAEDLMDECQNCRRSAAGPDGFEPAEMAMLPWEAYERMAQILNMVEEGGERGLATHATRGPEAT